MADARPGRLASLSSSAWLALVMGALVAAALVGLAVSLIALDSLGRARERVVDRLDPARLSGALLLSAYLDQETALRGYVLSGRARFLAPGAEGRARASRERRALETIAATGDVPGLARRLAVIDAAAGTWRRRYADPAQEAIQRLGTGATDVPDVDLGKTLFDDLRAALTGLDRALADARGAERGHLRRTARVTLLAALFAAALLLLGVVIATITVRRVVARPLARLTRDVRHVAEGDLRRPMAGGGPRDIAGLSDDVESMRQRIVAELEEAEDARARVEAQARDLERSNAELEQFAYIASHDLQEPLRKVASFVGMLQHRYQGQLDERADQYIAYAVDGAQRMQALIDDLLAFSRVGRSGEGFAELDLGELAAAAIAELEPAIAEAGAAVWVEGPLPRVRGERALLSALLTNLLINAIKFRGDRPPRVRVAARRDGERWIVAVDDNGIGIEPRHAQRVFEIFARLHGQRDYPGTGIGLAMCRRIVEHHGGEIWVLPEGQDGGASLRFTLPVGLTDSGPDSSDG